MNGISPSSPLITLSLKPSGNTGVKDILARFRPVMKQRGFGNFEMEQVGFYLASKPGDGIFTAEKFVFAEVVDDAVIINIDGHSIFGLKGVEQELNAIKTVYDTGLDCQTELNGPNYASAFIGNLLYTALPIYSSAFLIMFVMYQFGGFRMDLFNVLLYATMAVIGAKTRFWVNERRKQRPVWKSILFMVLAVPVLLTIIGLVFWAVRSIR